MLKYDVSLLSDLKISVEDNKPNQNVEFFPPTGCLFIVHFTAFLEEVNRIMYWTLVKVFIESIFTSCGHIQKTGPFKSAQSKCLFSHRK